MNQVTDADWLGLCIATETNLAHEMPPVARVIRNRVAHRRWPNTIRDVILQPKQFSHFNPFLEAEWDGDEDLYRAVVEGRANYGKRIDSDLLGLATSAAHDLLDEPPWRAPFGPKVCFYYSPVSMQPRGKKPWWWDKEIKRTIELPGIDPYRFRFGEMP